MKIIVIIMAFFLFVFCESPVEDVGIEKEDEVERSDDKDENEVEWLIPSEEVFDGGPGKDGIPSVDEPVFILAKDADFLTNEDLVLVVQYGDIVKAYPHGILNWHEIVNDHIGNNYYAVTYCPLTGTGLAWNGKINGKITEFGVSGFLYNSNLLPYDRETNSVWSQVRQDCVNGDLQGIKANNISMVETSWATAVSNFPKLQVLSTETGFNRSYTRYPYGGYTSTENLIFPVSTSDKSIHAKERVMALFEDEEAHVFRFGDFDGDTKIIEYNTDKKRYLVVGSSSDNFMVAFDVSNDKRKFTISSDDDAIIKDSSGNNYNLLGLNVSDNSKVDVLNRPVNYIGYWFTFPAFFEEVVKY